MAARTRGVKGSKGQAEKPEMVRVKWTIQKATLRKLQVLGLGLGVDRLGQLVDDLVASQPTRFILVDRARATLGTDATPRQEGQEARQGPPSLGVVSEAG